MLHELTHYCDQCQKHDRFSKRFVFIIKNDVDFNFNLIVDIFYFNDKSIFHVMNEAIRFQTNQWLKNISVKHVWKQIRFCWINTYLKSSDFISIDAEKQFITRKFKQYVINMKITIKIVFVETHHSIDQIERYHESFRRIYTIIITEISDIDFELKLQMIFKIINDSIDFNELIFTLFVFDVYSRIIKMNASFFIVIQRVVIIKKTINEIKKHIASRQIKNIFNIWNKSSTISVRNFSLNSEILIFRKNIENQTDAWKKLYKFFDLKNETIIIKFFWKSTQFRIIIIKSYYRSNDAKKTEHSSFSIDEKKIKKFDRLNFIHFYRSKWFWNHQVIKCFEHRIINRAIDQTQSWKLKKILNLN